MPVPGTDTTLTVDANSVKYYFLHLDGHMQPRGLNVKRIADFCNSILNKHSIAVNDFIRNDYEGVLNPQRVKNWLAKRLQKDLAIHVGPIPLQQDIRCCLRNGYGFDCSSRDAKYIQTCQNTIFKRLVTEDIEHFHRPHKGKNRRAMPAYLKEKLDVLIYRIDECCSALLDH